LTPIMETRRNLSAKAAILSPHIAAESSSLRGRGTGQPSGRPHRPRGESPHVGGVADLRREPVSSPRRRD